MTLSSASVVFFSGADCRITCRFPSLKYVFRSSPMDLIDTLAPLGLVGMFVGNELCFALATESYGMVYIPIRAAVIPACSVLLAAGSVVRWWIAHRDVGEQNKRHFWHLAGAIVGISILAFQWFSAGTLFSK